MHRTASPRLSALAASLAASLAAAAGLSVPSPATAGPAQASLVLGTPDQLAGERLVLAVLADPAVKARQAEVRASLLADPAAALPEGLTTLDDAIRQWTTSLALGEIEGDPAHPRILWGTDDTPHTWFGHTFGGSGVSGDNPDHIYRGARLDGGGRYEILGQVAPNRPAQFSFELNRSVPAGQFVLQRQTPGHADMGGQLAMLIDPAIQTTADGHFRLLLDGDPADGRPNHVHLEPGPVSVAIRDVLSDWAQQPNRLEIRRLDALPAGPDLTEAQVRDRVVAELPAYAHFWSGFKETWLGGLKRNAIVGPVRRDGGWGYLAAGRYHLAPDEAIVITADADHAAYIGLQATGPWGIGADTRRHETSLNPAQAKADPGGTITYVVSPTDPGLANWIDTGGLHDGFLVLRWEGFPSGAEPQNLLRSFAVVKLSDLGGAPYAGLPRVTPAQRREQLKVRTTQYERRLVE